MTPSSTNERKERTGVLTRNEFESRLRARLPSTQSALLCMGIDRLAHCNYVLGFEEVDQLLVRFADGISRTANHDFVGRTGGGEFCTFVETGVEAPVLAERLRAFAETTFASESTRVKDGAAKARVTDPGPHALTLSIGIADCNDVGPDARKLIEAARAAMFEAKRLGRNRVFLHLA